MEQANWIEELEAQIDTHGPDKVTFELDDSDHTQMIITDVQFTDGVIQVTVGVA